MQWSRTGRVAAFALLAAIAGCPDSTTGVATSFTASMLGAYEVPAVTTNATGSATFSISGTTLTFTLNYTGLTATQSHIHIGPPDETGGVAVTLCSATTTACSSGLTGTRSLDAGQTQVADFAELVDELRTRGAYVNVHTTANPGGEIRGTIFGVY